MEAERARLLGEKADLEAARARLEGEKADLEGERARLEAAKEGLDKVCGLHEQTGGCLDMSFAVCQVCVCAHLCKYTTAHRTLMGACEGACGA